MTKDPTRNVFCNRTLNLRSIRAIGYDMDYTLVHYRVEEWERRAYEYIKQQFLSEGWPVEGLHFDPQLICRGLIIDTARGNLIKANRFGFVKRAMHGTRAIDFDVQRDTYSRTIIDLSEKGWVFLNTLFSLSEGCMYAQLVDLLDQRLIPETLGYADLYERVRQVINLAHMEGKLKADIMADPARFVDRDPDAALALLDQRNAGKKLMLITNSEWFYTASMMSYCFDPYLPSGMTWRGLFDIVIVGARKPQFFTTDAPFFEILNDEGLMKPNPPLGLRSGVAYLGGSARELEKSLKLSGDELLYVGDHMFGDVHVTKNVLRWRTALVLRELEEELAAVESFRPSERKMATLMNQKEELEAQLSQLRVQLLRRQKSYGPPVSATESELQSAHDRIRGELLKLDHELGPLAKASAELNNPIWGLLMRAGNDKSHLAYQLERFADIYTSRVSNFLFATPYVYLRSPRGSLPHDASLTNANVSTP